MRQILAIRQTPRYNARGGYPISGYKGSPGQEVPGREPTHEHGPGDTAANRWATIEPEPRNRSALTV